MAGRPKKVIEEGESEEKSKKKSIDYEYLSADYILERPTEIIPTTPALDLALGGGLPQGSTVIVAAQPKLGKSVLCLQIIANAQKMGKIGVYVAAEERVANIQKILRGIPDLDLSPEKFKIIKSTQGKIFSAEEYLMRAERALIDFPECVMVFDSLSSLCPSSEQTNQYEDVIMGGSSKLQAKFCRRTAPIIGVNRNVLIAIVHIQANLSPYGGPTENVGMKFQYKVDVHIKAKKANPFEWKINEEQIGHIVNFEVLESALNSPGGTSTGWLRYGFGYSYEAEIINLGIEMGLIDQNGSWYTLQEGEKFHGWESIYNHLIENKSVYLNLYNRIKEML